VARSQFLDEDPEVAVGGRLHLLLLVEREVKAAVAGRVRAAAALRGRALRDLLDQLTYRERRVLELRYGLGGEKPRTLDELGRMFNVTRERIRQIESQSLQKLVSMAEAGHLE
jgi:RNA polymerase sigma factor (sigma-70 family)